MVFPVVMYGCKSWTIKKLSTEELMLLNCGVWKDSWNSLGLQRDLTSQSSRKSFLNIHSMDWCWSWNSNNLAIWCKELTHLKRPWCWEKLKVGGEGDDRGWDGWMVSLTWWTWVWSSSRSWTGLCCFAWASFSCSARASHCGGLSCCSLWAPENSLNRGGTQV